ncbi:MAG: hypothetical protein GDA40_12155 [Rhodobacteraceae bacterium]|nr:hypothetical protein [Paracoccaceae bacterium]
MRAAWIPLHEETPGTAALMTIQAQIPGWLTYDFPPALVPRLFGGRFRGQKQKWFLMRFHGGDADVNIATALTRGKRTALDRANAHLRAAWIPLQNTGIWRSSLLTDA